MPDNGPPNARQGYIRLKSIDILSVLFLSISAAFRSMMKIFKIKHATGINIMYLLLTANQSFSIMTVKNNTTAINVHTI